MVPGGAAVEDDDEMEDDGAGGQEEAESPQQWEAGLDNEDEGCDEKTGERRKEIGGDEDGPCQPQRQ